MNKNGCTYSCKVEIKLCINFYFTFLIIHSLTHTGIVFYCHGE